MLIVDGHQDLAWNMLTFGRDYSRSAAETRRLENGGIAPQANGDTLLGWPEYQQAQVGVVFATLFAAPERRRLGDWDTQCYADTSQAKEHYRAQLDRYYRLVDDHPDRFRLIFSEADLDRVLAHWDQEQEHPDGHPVGLVILMEGAEGIGDPGELEGWWEAGVRLVGPAWAGNRFCGGTREPGPLTAEGYELLEAMSGIGFVLDLSHMDEPAALQALEMYPGVVLASHSNALALLKGAELNRHLSDRVIHGIIERDGVIGIVPLNAFLLAGWRRGDPREPVSIERVVAQIDHICQLAGDAHHVGIGSDFDGGFGLQSVPHEIDTIVDLNKLVPLLQEKGYAESDVERIMGGNWLRVIRPVLSEAK